MMSEMRPDVLCPACEGKGGSGLFWKRKCALCEDKWYLYTRPHECSACSGRGKRRENGRVLESVCVLCTGTGWTKRKLTKCAICSNRSALAGFFARSAPPCSACRLAGWVEGKQENCILCEGKGQLGAPSARMGVGTAAMGVSAGAAAAGPVGAAVGAWGAAWLLMQHVRECHGCKGVKVRTGPQHPCPRCETSGMCVSAGSRRVTCLLCNGEGIVEFATIPCKKCEGDGVVRGWFSRDHCETCRGRGFFNVEAWETVAQQGPATADPGRRSAGGKMEKTAHVNKTRRARPY